MLNDVLNRIGNEDVFSKLSDVGNVSELVIQVSSTQRAYKRPDSMLSPISEGCPAASASESGCPQRRPTHRLPYSTQVL